MKTTLNKIRAHSPCDSGWKKLLTNLGKTKADDEPLALTIILESNGLDDALWCLRAVDGHEREMRLFAVKCARSVQHLLTDKRSINALDVAKRYANGQATQAELTAARAAAWDAARAVEAAACSAARDAWAAAWDAARDAWAAGDAAEAAAWDAARAAAEDARAATGAVAWAAARAAAEDAAWYAAYAAASDAQANLFILMCEGAL